MRERPRAGEGVERPIDQDRNGETEAERRCYRLMTWLSAGLSVGGILIISAGIEMGRWRRAISPTPC